MKRIIFLFMIFVSFYVNALPEIKKGIYIFQIKTHTAKLVEGDLLPNRMYVVYQESLKGWVWMKTDNNGKFTTPHQMFIPLSVVSGPILGGQDGMRYKLNPNKRWIRTIDKEEFRLYIEDKKPFFRISRLTQALTKRLNPFNPPAMPK